MTTKEMQLAADFLTNTTDELSNHVCNDWMFPDFWSTEERQQFVREYHEWNGDPEEFNPNFLFLPNWAVAGFLAHKLERDSH